MATGPAEPFASDQTHWEEDAPARRARSVDEIDADRVVDPAMRCAPAWTAALRLRHMMYLIAAVAILLLAGDCWPSTRPSIGALLVMGGFVFLCSRGDGRGRHPGSRTGPRGRIRCCRCWRSRRSAACRWRRRSLAFADQYRGLSYRRIMDLAARLNWGTSPSRGARAVAQAGLARRGLAGLGRSGRRHAAAGACGWPPRPGRHQLPIWTAISARLSYILGLLLVMQTITAFIMYFIVPKFEAIFKDFGVSLPQVTILVIDVSHFFIKYGFITALDPARRDRLARVSPALVSGVE